MSKKVKILTVNKSQDYFESKGLPPDFHVLLDPKDWVAGYVTNIRPDIQYFLGSTIAEPTWKRFRDAKADAYIWHPYGAVKDENGLTEEMMLQHNFPGQEYCCIPGPSTVVLRSIVMGIGLGFGQHEYGQLIETHGLDGSANPKGGLYAYDKANVDNTMIEFEVGAPDGEKRVFVSNFQMSRQVYEFMDLLKFIIHKTHTREIAPVSLKVHGNIEWGAIPWLAHKIGIHADNFTQKVVH